MRELSKLIFRSAPAARRDVEIVESAEFVCRGHFLSRALSPGTARGATERLNVKVNKPLCLAKQ